MKIAVGGKGGSGKTTFSGTLARALAQSGHRVLAIDGDSNPNLAVTLGIPGGAAQEIPALPRDLLVDAPADGGARRRMLGRPPAEVIESYGVAGPDGIHLILGGRVGHAGTGCMCGAHARVRTLLGELIGREWQDQDVIVDLEAGLENFSRGTPRSVDAIIVVLEPFYRSMETGRRVWELARELGVGRVWAVANRIRSEADLDAVQSFCEAHGTELIGALPFDEALLDADRAGKAPIDHDPCSPAVMQVRRIAESLFDRPIRGKAGSEAEPA